MYSMRATASCLLAFSAVQALLVASGIVSALSALAPFAEVPGVAPVPSSGGALPMSQSWRPGRVSPAERFREELLTFKLSSRRFHDEQSYLFLHYSWRFCEACSNYCSLQQQERHQLVFDDRW